MYKYIYIKTYIFNFFIFKKYSTGDEARECMNEFAKIKIGVI